MRNALFSL